MARLSAIVPICILISSCSLHDTGEVSNEEAPAAPPAVLEQAPPAGPEEQTAPRPLPPPVRVITVDNVRRLQTRLREVGLDSGPVDGVPGAKTKLAFNRLQAGCAKLERLRVEHPLVREQGGSAGGKIPARDEVTQIQAELRAADVARDVDEAELQAAHGKCAVDRRVLHAAQIAGVVVDVRELHAAMRAVGDVGPERGGDALLVPSLPL